MFTKEEGGGRGAKIWLPSFSLLEGKGGGKEGGESREGKGKGSPGETKYFGQIIDLLG
jgi:hypothetical protein